MAEDGPGTEVEGPAESESSQRSDFPSPRRYHTDFRPGTDLAREEWLSLRTPFETKIELTSQGLRMKAGESLTSLFHQSLIARRFESVSFTAGLVCYYNTKVFYYLYIGFDEAKQQRMVNILCNDNFHFYEPLEGKYIYLPEEAQEVELQVRVSQERLQFYFRAGGGPLCPAGPVLDTGILSDEHAEGWAYTGAVVGITAVDHFNSAVYRFLPE